MEYHFKYKSPQEKKTFTEKYNKALSDLLFSFYRSRLFKKLRFRTDFIIQSHVNYKTDRSKDVINEFDYTGLNTHTIIFSDAIKIENTKKFKKQIIKVIQKLKPAFLQENPKKTFGKSFDQFEFSFDTISFGNIFRGSVISNDQKLDLIKSISIGYIKGQESYFIVKYSVTPTDKFNSLLKEALESNGREEVEIQNPSVLDFFRTGKKTKQSGVSYSRRDSNYLTNKLFNEINHQLKNILLQDLNLGIFKTNRDLLFPQIPVFEYDSNNFENYEQELYRNIGRGFNNVYKTDDIRFTLSHCDLKRNPCESINILFKKRELNKEDNGFNDIHSLSRRFSDSLLPKWMLMNIASAHQNNIVLFRKRIFEHIRKNKPSLFLSKTIKLKNELTLNSINFQRLKKDLLSSRLNHNFGDERLPIAIRDCGQADCKKQHVFTDELNESVDFAESNISESFNDLIQLFQTVSEDNHVRANMRLQRLLFRLAILGIILTIYGANPEWINSWIEYFINQLGFSIPRL